MAFLAGLDSALASRRKFVDANAEIAEAVADGTRAGSVGGSGGHLFQGGMIKSPTGFVGLVNQGATCYLNSLLQTLYMLPEFRGALISWKYDPFIHGDEERCLARQLQRLFVQLQLSSRPAITTGALTKSFGWTAQVRGRGTTLRSYWQCLQVFVLPHLALTPHLPFPLQDAFVQQDVTECLTAIMAFLESQVNMTASAIPPCRICL